MEKQDFAVYNNIENEVNDDEIDRVDAAAGLTAPILENSHNQSTVLLPSPHPFVRKRSNKKLGNTADFVDMLLVQMEQQNRRQEVERKEILMKIEVDAQRYEQELKGRREMWELDHKARREQEQERRALEDERYHRILEADRKKQEKEYKERQDKRECEERRHEQFIQMMLLMRNGV